MKHSTLPFLVLLVLLAASCTSGTEGIFASIEREQKIVSLGGLSETATVTSMAELGAPVNKYFATGGKALFSRSTDASSHRWHKATVGGESAVAAVGLAGTKLYAVAGGKLFVSTNGSDWSKVSLGSSDVPFDLVPIRKGDGYSIDGLIVVTVASRAYKNAYRIDATGTLNTTAMVLSSSSPAEPVHSAVTDGTDLFVASRTSLTKIAADLTVSSLLESGTFKHDFGGLIYLDTSVGGGGHEGFYLTTLSKGVTGGGVYKSSVATPASFSALESDVQALSNPVTLGMLLYNDVNQTLWIATGATNTAEGSGYLELSLSSDSLLSEPRTDANNYNSSVLPTSALGTLYRSTAGLSFIGTVAHGLWLWDSSAKTWSQQ